MSAKSTPTFSTGDLGVLTPAPHFTVPETEEYHIASRGRLMQLKKGRRDLVVETLLVAVGALAGSIVSSVAALTAWPLDLAGFLNCLLSFGSISVVVVCLCIAHGKANDFDEAMAEILKGRRFDKHGTVIANQPGAENTGDDPAN